MKVYKYILMYIKVINYSNESEEIFTLHGKVQGQL